MGINVLLRFTAFVLMTFRTFRSLQDKNCGPLVSETSNAGRNTARKFLEHECIFAEAEYAVAVGSIEWAMFLAIGINIRPSKAEISTLI